MSCLWAVIEQMIISTNQLLIDKMLWYQGIRTKWICKINIEFEIFLVKAL